MSDLHDTIRNDLPAYALGSLDADAASRIDRHLQECDECRMLLHEYNEVLRLLPFGLPIAEPTHTARRELFQRLRHNNADSSRRRASRWWPRLRFQTLTAVLVVGIVIIGAFAISQGDHQSDAASFFEGLRSSSQTRIIPMNDSGRAPGAVAQLLFQPGTTRAGLVVSGLPLLESGRSYQLWFVTPEDERIDGGTFSVGAGGQAMVIVNAPANYAPGWTCGITEEPAGGSLQPTGEPILTGSYSSGTW